MKHLNLLVLAVLTFSCTSVFAKEAMDHSKHMDHSQHTGYEKQTASGALKPVMEVPKSGRARKAGSDDRYAMEPTSSKDSLQMQCAKGSRGLIMLDRETIEKCGGITKGMPEPVGMKEKVDHSGH